MLVNPLFYQSIPVFQTPVLDPTLFQPIYKVVTPRLINEWENDGKIQYQIFKHDGNFQSFEFKLVRLNSTQGLLTVFSLLDDFKLRVRLNLNKVDVHGINFQINERDERILNLNIPKKIERASIEDLFGAFIAQSPYYQQYSGNPEVFNQLCQNFQAGSQRKLREEQRRQAILQEERQREYEQQERIRAEKIRREKEGRIQREKQRQERLQKEKEERIKKVREEKLRKQQEYLQRQEQQQKQAQEIFESFLQNVFNPYVKPVEKESNEPQVKSKSKPETAIVESVPTVAPQPKRSSSPIAEVVETAEPEIETPSSSGRSTPVSIHSLDGISTPEPSSPLQSLHKHPSLEEVEDEEFVMLRKKFGQ